MDRPHGLRVGLCVGRALSTLANLGTILFAWLLARRVFGVRTAHLTALLLALTVLEIQLSHFFAVDTFAACFAAGALFFGQRAWQRESLLDGLLAGAFVGFAMASKVSAAILIPVLGLAFVWPRQGRPTLGQFFDGVTSFGVMLVGAFFAFRITEPYASRSGHLELAAEPAVAVRQGVPEQYDG